MGKESNKENTTPLDNKTEAVDAVVNKLPILETYSDYLEKGGYQKQAEAYRRVLDMASAFKQEGGRALLVGGSVRDMMIGEVVKDFDLEVYHLNAAKVEEIAKRFGEVSDVGRAFGILKISFGEGVDIDISLPRTDSKIGVGHRGFEVKTSPDMSVIEAARRRDFTINSMAADPLTGEFFDPFGGKQDLQERWLRVTDHERFRDDPLRALRAMQFVGRFGLEIEPKSLEIIREVALQLKELPSERRLEEWKKLLLRSEKPSLGLSAALTTGILRELHPEIIALRETPQEEEWHPEGDVWIHTLMAVDEAARIVKRERLDDEKALTVMLATLAHDFGKPHATEFKEGRLRAHGHEEAGVDPALQFLESLGAPNLTKEKVVKIVADHLKPSMLYIEEVVKGNKVGDGTIRRLAKRIHPATIQELVFCAEADHTGRGPFIDPEVPDQYLLPLREYPAGKWLLKRARELNIELSRPPDVIQGRDLIAAGFKPGIAFGEIIELANKLRDEHEYTRENILQAIQGRATPDDAIHKLNKLDNFS